MTTIQETEPAVSANSGEEGQTWGGIAFGFASQIAGENFQRGDLAQLRRMQPDAPDAAAYWHLMADRSLLGNAAWEAKWALILHGIALMTRTSGNEGAGRTAHDGHMAVGRALFLGGDSSRRGSGYYSESRLNRLLTARGPILRTLLARMFRMMAAANQPFNWGEMARFVLYEGYDEERLEQARRHLARAYYQAARRSAQAAESEDA
ncbi:MAG: type I-E CRISPR-associated protein Cse2/CasB [Candidatus Tectomicrobia bacterium]|nr:type I-E CRISPR-associated protein Cse2/CasB [Candidatus Tectomicrobia bacterium]